MKLFRIIKEINNYFFIKRTIRKNQETEQWKKHNLKVGYFNVIYTVINLPPDVFESEEQYYQMYVIEQLKPINEYLASLNLQEVVTLSMDNKCDPASGIYAFGIKYVPLFRDFSWFWMLKWIVIITAGIWSFMKFNVFSLCKSLIDYIQVLFN